MALAPWPLNAFKWAISQPTARYSISSVAEIAAVAATTMGGRGGNCFDANKVNHRKEKAGIR